MDNLIHLIVIFLCVGFYEGKDCPTEIHVPTGYQTCGRPNCYCKGNRARCFKIGDDNIQLPSHITNLYIDCSDITNFTSNTLPDNVNLTYFHIIKSGVSIMKNDSFSKQPFIRLFEVTSCVFHEDRAMLFEAMAALKQLTEIKMEQFDISNTSLLHFSHINVSKVTDLSFKDNQLLEFNATFFSSFTSLRNLDLRNNRINDMTNMATFSNLHNISMQDNQLKIPALHFCMENGTSWFPNLQSLRLASNNIIDFPFLQIFCLENLKELDLAKNTLKEFNVGNISSFKKLQYISLRENWLQKIIPGHFPPALKKLDFEHNEFTGPFPPKLCDENSTEKFPNITDLNFRECSIMKFWIDNWALCLPNLRVLDFGLNLMFVSSNTSIARFPNLEELNLDNNRFKYISEHMLNTSSLKRLKLRSNPISFGRPENRKLFKNSPSITDLDISNNVLGVLSEDNLTELFSPLKQLNRLTMRKCKIEIIPTGILRNLTKLSSLDLYGNLLTDIYFPKDLKTNLTTLSVADNKIQLITEKSFNRQLQKKLKALNLQSNAFHCGCDLMWFRDTITPDGKFGEIELTNWPNGYYCRDEKYKGKLLVNFSISKSQCSPLNGSITTYIIMGCSCFVIAVLGFVLYWNRWYVQLKWLQVKGLFSDNDETEREHQYSGYVINHDNDRDFVNNVFRYRMEDKLGYRLHIWNRNSNAGKAKVDEILDAMDASKAVFVIVSNDLLTWSWGIFQVDVAISRKIEDNRRNIFFVLLEDINCRNLSKSWCVMLTKMPGVPWCNEPDSIKSQLFDQEVKTILGPSPVSMGCIQQSYGSIDNICEDIANDSINLEWQEHNREVPRIRNSRQPVKTHIRRPRNTNDVGETEPLLGSSRGSIRECGPYESIYAERTEPAGEPKESHKSENSPINGEAVVSTASAKLYLNETKQNQFTKTNTTGSSEEHEHGYINYTINEKMSERCIAKDRTSHLVGDAMNRYVTMDNPDDYRVTDPDIEKVPDGQFEKRSEAKDDCNDEGRHAIYVEDGKSTDSNRHTDSGFVDT